jgi:hypothetical protein
MRGQSERRFGLEVEVIDGVRVEIGRDPRKMTPAELTAAGHEKLSAVQALRARCLDCCCGSAAEVRRCVSVNCPSWPFRMGTDPWRAKVELSAERREQLAASLAKARAARG